MNHQKLVFASSLILLTSNHSLALPQGKETSGIAQAQVVFEFSEVVITGGDPRERAVAFHSITFIDSIAHPIDEIIFGTAEANALQGQGWFANELSANVGTFQWAGGAARQATMQLTIPQSTEGLLLKITSVKDSLWMNVKIDGELAATLRVDGYWHQGYVPIGEPIPEPKPNTAPEWFVGRYFPRFPSTNRVYAFRARTSTSEDPPGAWQPEWRINNSLDDMMALTLVGMQGIINRNQPRVYFDWRENYGSSSAFWIPRLEEHIEVVYLDLDGLSSFNFLMRRYASRFSGAVIYDPEIPETINLATTIAGLDDRVMLAPEQLALPGVPDFASIVDLRQLAQEQGWDDSIASQTGICQWMYDNLWPQLEKHIIGLISPGPPSSGEVDAGRYFPLGFSSRDYIVALRLPVLYLDPSHEPQSRLFSQFLNDAPSPIPVYGFFAGDEKGTVALASRHGNWVPVITNTNTPLEGGNLTVFSGVRPDIVPYRPEMNTGRILATLGDRPVVAMFSTDGDNLQYQMHLGFPDFNWLNVQNQPVCWSTNPTLIDLAPVIWNYYMESSSGISFWSHYSGAGYMYPILMNEAQLDGYLAYAIRYLNATGLKTLSVDTHLGWNDQLAKRYYDKLHETGLLGIHFGFGPIYGLGVIYSPDVRLPQVWAEHVLNASTSAKILNDILSYKPSEFLTDITAERNSHFILMGELVQDNDALGGKTVFVSPAHITDPNWTLAVSMFLFSFAPGNYKADFRLKVPDNRNANRVARISAIGRSFPDGFIFQDLAPSHFQEAGQYQDFTLSFTLEDHIPDMSFRVEYFGTTDLYFDYIHITRTDGPALPVFRMMGIAGGERDLDRVPGRFAQNLESAGGIVLTPDEFMGALNPEYMIELAKPILGAGHDALTKAQQQLDAGKYFNSLLTVREALRQINGPKISLAFTSIDFDTVEIGDTQSKELIIGNNGTASLNVADVTITNSAFNVSPTIFSILPVNSQTVTVRFVPSLHQVYSDTLVIHSNAIDNPIVKIPMSATGVFSQAPRITAIEDVPNDQGGHVRITFYPSRYDGSDATHRISTYSVERQLENDNWEAIGSFEAKQDSIYHFVAPTLGDSTANGIVWTTFRISARVDSSEILFISGPESGYAVDNIAPRVPQGLAAQPKDGGILLTWKRNQENDIQQYAIYRSTDEKFDPATMPTYTYATADTFYLDEIVSRDTTYYYAISAFDHGGNESDFSSKVSAALVTEIADGDDPQIPQQYQLYQNYPNPFNAMTRIRFDLPKGDEVKISVFDVKGNLVREISKKAYKAGHHEVILNTAGFATGIYFYKIEADKFAEVKKLVLIK